MVNNNGIRQVQRKDLFEKRQLRVNEEEVTYTLYNEFILPNEKGILNSKNKLSAIVKNYIAKHSARIGLRGPTTKLPFLESDKNIIYNSCNVKRQDLYDASQKIEGNDIDTHNHLVEDPFFTMCGIMASVFLRADKAMFAKIKDVQSKGKEISDEEKYKSPIYLIVLYLGLAFYGKIYIKFFYFDPDPEVMDYTIENLSQKYLLKKCNNMLEFIKYHTDTNIENMYDRLMRGADVDILYFVSNLYNRMVHAMRIISNAFYENKAKGNKIGSDSANKTNDEGKFYVGDVASISSDLNFAIRRVITSFFNETIVNDKLVDKSCYKTKFSKSRFIIILQKIRENPKSEPRLKDIFCTAIGYFIIKLGGTVQEIKSSKFIVSMIKSYSVSNTKDEFILGMKDLLNKLIHENLTTIIDEGNANLVDRCRMSLFIYFVLYIASTMD